MIRRKQITNLEKLTRVINKISGRADSLFSQNKKDIEDAKILISTLQQDKAILTIEVNNLRNKIDEFDIRIKKVENNKIAEV